MFQWFASDSGYHSNTSLLHFILNNFPFLNLVRHFITKLLNLVLLTITSYRRCLKKIYQIKTVFE